MKLFCLFSALFGLDRSFFRRSILKELFVRVCILVCKLRIAFTTLIVVRLDNVFSDNRITIEASHEAYERKIPKMAI